MCREEGKHPGLRASAHTETLDLFTPAAALFADFVGKLALHLSLATVFVTCALSSGCGKDADQKYAGLKVITASAADGLGYRVRYLNPPWESSHHDPLVLGSDTTIELRGKKDQAFIAGTATVLEIERQSIVDNNGGTLAKYRFEAMLLDCDLGLASGESCAEQIAIADNEARKKAGEPSFYTDEDDGKNDAVRRSTNDFEQKYFELLTRNPGSRRYKRIAYIETPDAQRYLRVYFESNPRLDEAEVTRMLNAIETFEDPGLARTDADASISADAGSEGGAP